MSRILGDLRIFQAVHNDLGLRHELVTDSTGKQRYAYVYDGADPYELEDRYFPTIVKAFAAERSRLLERVLGETDKAIVSNEYTIEVHNYRKRVVDGIRRLQGEGK